MLERDLNRGVKPLGCPSPGGDIRGRLSVLREETLLSFRGSNWGLEDNGNLNPGIDVCFAKLFVHLSQLGFFFESLFPIPVDSKLPPSAEDKLIFLSTCSRSWAPLSQPTLSHSKLDEQEEPESIFNGLKSSVSSVSPSVDLDNATFTRKSSATLRGLTMIGWGLYRLKSFLGEHWFWRRHQSHSQAPASAPSMEMQQ